MYGYLKDIIFFNSSHCHKDCDTHFLPTQPDLVFKWMPNVIQQLRQWCELNGKKCPLIKLLILISHLISLVFSFVETFTTCFYVCFIPIFLSHTNPSSHSPHFCEALSSSFFRHWISYMWNTPIFFTHPTQRAPFVFRITLFRHVNSFRSFFC